jgi:hypothetical protein
MSDEQLILNQIKDQQRLINVRQISISIGELLSWHEKKRILLNPSYQRQFRWDSKKQSELIESIILGLPLPSIFLYANSSKNYYEVMDGLQRITTLLDFFNNDLQLQGLDILTELNGLFHNQIPFPVDFDLTGSRLDLQVLNQTTLNDELPAESVKYELFVRLNSGGIALTPQEVRNCMLDQASPKLTEFLKKLSDNTNLDTTINLSESKTKKGTLQEWILRFMLLQEEEFRDDLQRKGVKVNDWITGSAFTLIKNHQQAGDLDAYLEKMEHLINRTFELLSSCKDPLRKQKGTSLRAFELVAISLGSYLQQNNNSEDLSIERLDEAISLLWTTEIEDGRDTSKERSNFRTWNNVTRGFKAFNQYFSN